MLCKGIIACNPRIEVSSFQLFRSPHKIIMMLCIQNKKSNHFILLYHHFFASSNTFSLQFTFYSITSQALFGITVSWADLNQQNQGNDVQLPATCQLPEYDESPTVNFLHKRVLSFLTALPALLTSQVPGLGPNGVLDTIKTNCQQCLEASGLIYIILLENFMPSPAQLYIQTILK